MPRPDATNLSMDIIRSLVTISDTGSFTKAAARMGLSQSAISAQIKKFQQSIGGALFENSHFGATPTPLGNAVLGHCRKMIILNDQMLSLTGGPADRKIIRFGVSYLYAEQYLHASAAQGPLRDVHIQAGHSDDLKRQLIDGYLDAACITAPEESLGLTIVDQWQEEMVWVRSKNFVLSPGQPVPLVGCAGASSESAVIKALSRSKLTYEITFVCSELHTRLAAVEQGMGLMCVPPRLVKEPLVQAREYYLPKVEPMRMAVCVREDLSGDVLDDIMMRLRPATPERITMEPSARATISEMMPECGN